MSKAAYICEECGHGERLTAWATVLAEGALNAEGEVEEDWTEQTELHEDSIQCREHHDAAILKLVEGRYTRWQTCSWVQVEQDRAARSELRVHVRSRCVDGSRMYFRERIGACPCCGGRGGHDVPVDTVHECGVDGAPEHVQVYRRQQAVQTAQLSGGAAG